MKTWLEPAPVIVPAELQTAIGGHPLVAEELVRRGFRDLAAAQRFLNPAHYVPASANDLPDMDQAVSRVQKAIRQGERILVWGDFDVDGQTATALLVEALRGMGARLTYHIPNRFSEGHGIALPKLKELFDGGVELLLTCDTGISAHEAVDYAESRGVNVVITDHHALPDTLPAARAVVNPMRLPEHHPLRELSGVGTAYKLVEALHGGTEQESLLDLVALGLVADVMVQVDDTRYLLQRGLNVLRQASRPGLRAMMERARINPAELNEEHIGFEIGPRLNALGRLEDATPAVDLLTTSDAETIAVLVNRLEGLNAERKLLTHQVYAGAKAQIERDPSLLDYAALVIAYPGWHTGILGIVASRLAEQYNRPVVMLSTSDGIAHGSARSVEGCDITAALRRHSDLLNRFGGHTMAAGLSLPEANLMEFRRALSRTVRDRVGPGIVIQPALTIDGYLTLPELTLELAEDIARLSPFGNGNPPLTLAARNLHLTRSSTLGRREEHLRLEVEDDAGNTRRVIWWNGADETLPDGRFDLAFTLRVNDYKGRREVLVEWLDARPVEDAAGDLRGKSPWEMVDYRTAPDPLAQLEKVDEAYPGALVWGEGGADIMGTDRYRLQAAETLIVWTAPPGTNEWQRALEVVRPRRLILFGLDPESGDFEGFLRRLAGLVKYVLNSRSGALRLTELAAAMAQTEHTVSLGLDWLAADGQMVVVSREGDNWQLARPGTPDPETRRQIGLRLQKALSEALAYRNYWRGKSTF